jgi:hypothetical protein
MDMTSETRKFIGVSDIIALRLECRSCGCSLLIDVSRDGGPVENLMLKENFTLAKCPTCSHPWTANQIGGVVGWDSEIKEFLRKMRALKQVEEKFGCAITLEIRNEEESK